ncbi:hypothetical protein [Pelomonas sp. KK5]|uniref:hypothetical protein n=1 Tax=Pelomonas sp. KK5 TaxID=1855730 RepID=UPI00097BAB9F|nr:hypothetical protein [Pelomonas sp. KK5]
MKNRLKTRAALLALAAAALAFTAPAHAHGSTKPEHGGIVQMSGETLLELSVKPDSVALYLKDDDEDVPSAGMSARLTITYKGAKTELNLEPAGGNKFEAKGVRIAAGSKVGVMLVNKATQAKVSALFSID